MGARVRVMARDGVAVDARVAGAVARVVAGEVMNVSAVCREVGVSRQTFYRYVARFAAEGVEGLYPRSRAPYHRPRMVSVQVEDAVVAARKRLAEDGWDNGALSIHWWLVDHPEAWRGPDTAQVPVPSRATIHRILVRRGQVTPQPGKRPRRSGRRFTRPYANDLWQMDGYETRLADGRVVCVLEVFDDHTRLLLATLAAASESGQAAWVVFTTAAARYGLPAQFLTDNATAFNQHRRGTTAQLETALRALGVDPISSSTSHPQTCGKVERGHATGQRWLTRRDTPATLQQLQHHLEVYRDGYNQRRHQGLNGLTPTQAWALATVTGPAGHPLTPPLQVSTGPVSPAGCVATDRTEISIGRQHYPATATMFRTGDHVAVFIDGHLIRELTLDRTRRYQPQQH